MMVTINCDDGIYDDQKQRYLCYVLNFYATGRCEKLLSTYLLLIYSAESKSKSLQ